MKKGFILSAIFSVLLPILCACGNKSANTDTRCPALVEKAEYYNTQTANGTKEGPMGMKMSVEYIDSVYRIIQIVDESIIPAEKIKMFYGNMKQNMIVGISSSSGSERRDYKQMVDYRVTFEHVVKSKSTGDVIVRNTMTPDEIAEALEKQLTPLDELKMNVTTQKGTLPRGMEAGYTMNDISCSDGVVNIEIIVDEKMKDFDEATKLKAWSKAVYIGLIWLSYKYAYPFLAFVIESTQEKFEEAHNYPNNGHPDGYDPKIEKYFNDLLWKLKDHPLV